MNIIALALIILSSSTKNNDWVDEVYECPSSFINESEQDFIAKYDGKQGKRKSELLFQCI